MTEYALDRNNIVNASAEPEPVGKPNLTVGFYTALGTPLDENGELAVSGFQKQIRDQIDAGASGFLVMGSMGIQPYIKDSEYVRVARAAVDAVAGACPVFVGVMDNSVARVVDRIDSLKGLGIDGVVTTAPFYYPCSAQDVMSFFALIARRSWAPLYIYDLRGVTNVNIEANMVEALMAENNIKGIKLGDLTTARKLILSPTLRKGFDVLFSGLDVMDIAYPYGLNRQLDGMFSFVPQITSRLFSSLASGDAQSAARHLTDILAIRDKLVEVGVFRGYSYGMNLLGYEGHFCPDFTCPITKAQKAIIRECMVDYGLI